MRPTTQILVVLLGYAVLGSASAEIIHVPGDYPTVQEAIDAAVSGVDDVVVAPGSYNEIIDFLGKAITLRSSGGAAVTTIDGTGLNDSVVKCMNGESKSTVLDGFTITGGDAIEGGGMHNFVSSPTVINCLFNSNTAVTGGGMYNVLSDPAVFGCEYNSNTSALNGAALYNLLSHPEVRDCTFHLNSAGGSG